MTQLLLPEESCIEQRAGCILAKFYDHNYRI
jgi:hypothetical protein